MGLTIAVGVTLGTNGRMLAVRVECIGFCGWLVTFDAVGRTVAVNGAKTKKGTEDTLIQIKG